MTDTIDAIQVSDRIRSTYLRYLRTLLPFSDPALHAALRDAFGDGGELVRGPILEATPPYRPGASVRQLVDNGVLHHDLLMLEKGGLPVDRPLYLHQEQAVRRATAGRNIVVATGTGSGKTESFLLPVLDGLVREREAGTLGQPGVRALLLYPMNALANDQLSRLRTALEPFPDITFGRYTGETEHQEGPAADRFRTQFPGVDRLPNELLSRDEMQATPPHFLLTNYAMLEYLLLRPRDTSLFDGDTALHWRHVVLDEAHVYDGAAGIEVAMLLRRLSDRVAPERRLHAIATSATVGGTDAGPAVAEFATTLFGVPFEYGAEHHDVVWASRREVSQTDTWGPLPDDAYGRLLATDGGDERLALLRTIAPNAPEGDLFHVLEAEARIARIRDQLANGPRPIEHVAPQAFDGPESLVRTGELVSLCAAVHDAGGAPLLPARYHLWARATEGAFSCLAPEPHISLVRVEQCRTCARPAFELGSCKRCSTPYVIGTQQKVAGGEVLVAPKEQRASHRFFVLVDEDGVTGDGLMDEDDAVLEQLEEETKDLTAHRLCTRCGRLAPTGSTSCSGCGSTELRGVLRVEKQGVPKSCQLCGGRSNAGQVRRLESGPDASGAVLATTLYQSLPKSPVAREAELPGNGRKLLLFSDSRQDAAYFAPSFEGSYGQLVRRRLMLQAIGDVDDPDDPPQLDDVIARVRKLATNAGFFDWKASGQEKKRVAGTWVLAEAVNVSQNTSLEGLGLVAYGLRRPPGLSFPAPLLALGLSDTEAWDLVTELLRSIRMQGAITVPDDVSPDDDAFSPRLGPIHIRQSGPEAKRKILSWLPGRGSNARLDYLRRLLASLDAPMAAPDLAMGLWRWVTDDPTASHLLRATTKAGIGKLHQLEHELVTVRLVDEDRPVHRCSRCRRVTATSVHGVCPTMGCTGELTEDVPPPPTQDDDHYRQLARSLSLIPLSVREHTAQLSNDTAASTQQQFISAEVNALSCSTTFELGVDVGDLQSVLLRNVPPLTSNYVQRAGRAGRRTDAAALVVTYAQRRSHDLTYFRDPTAMIAGDVRPPRIDLGNERIAERHAFAIALAAWLRDEASAGLEYGKVAEFHDELEREAPGDARLIEWLRSPPVEVTDAMRRVIPADLLDLVGISDGSWAERLTELARKAGEQHRADVTYLREEETEASKERNHARAGLFKRTVNTLNRRYLLSHFANRNMLPKYGFPVDTVDLTTNHLPDAAAGQIELQRDLRLAISDYAPGSQLVARGLLWESGGVRRLPGRELESRHYVACTCGYYREDRAAFAIEACPSCGDQKSGTRVRQYVVPEFGFLAARKTPKRPSTKPVRSYANRVMLVHREDDAEPDVLDLAGSARIEHRYVERGELVVINDGYTHGGFRICNRCGWGEPLRGKMQSKKHPDPRTGRECDAFLEWLSLGHRFQTDVLMMQLEGTHVPRVSPVWHGLLYAMLESAAARFTISRDDLDGTIHLGESGPPTMVLFDDVPAGAGHVKRLRDDLTGILEDALVRTRDCECGVETSCYRCLRGFRNQRMHDELRRGAVAELLRTVLEGTSSAGASSGAPNLSPTQAADLTSFDGRTVRASIDGEQEIVGTIWIEADAGAILRVLIDPIDGSEMRDYDPGRVQIQESTH